MLRAIVLSLALATASCASSHLLQPSEPAPAFSAKDQSGSTRELAEFKGKPIVLYFYPKDGTPGCTKEACAFRDAWKKLQESGAIVIGVSRDSVEKHAAFAKEHDLPFPLLADENGAICKAYGVGSTLGMAKRVTYLVGRDGKVARAWPDVDPAIHVDQVIAAIRELPPG
ncbi:MAG: peroxiredoxin [Polyangiales bacterium]